MGQEATIQKGFDSGVLVVSEFGSGAAHVMTLRVNPVSEEVVEREGESGDGDGPSCRVLREARRADESAFWGVCPIVNSVVALRPTSGLVLYDYALNRDVFSILPLVEHRQMTYLPSQNLLVTTSAHQRPKIRLFQVNTNDDRFQNTSLLSTFSTGHILNTTSLYANDEVASNLVLTGSRDQSTRLFDIAREEVVTMFGFRRREDGGFVSSLGMNPMNGAHIVNAWGHFRTGNDPSSIGLWDARSSCKLVDRAEFSDSVQSLLWTKENQNVLMVGTYSEINTCDIRKLSSRLSHWKTGGDRGHYLTGIDSNRFGVSTAGTVTPTGRRRVHKGLCQVWGYNGKKHFHCNLFGLSHGICYSQPHSVSPPVPLTASVEQAPEEEGASDQVVSHLPECGDGEQYLYAVPRGILSNHSIRSIPGRAQRVFAAHDVTSIQTNDISF